MPEFVIAILLPVVTAGCLPWKAHAQDLDISTQAVQAWITRTAIPAERLSDFDSKILGVSILGLGEATHGQHESFELKRMLTMHLIRNSGFRTVAYEASASRALAADAYVQGDSDDLSAAVKGLGMLIWQVEENAALLRDLREWNAASATPEDRVHLIGFDVQDPQACAQRISAIAGPEFAQVATSAADLVGGLDKAVGELWSGTPASFLAIKEKVEGLAASVAHSDLHVPPELALRCKELTLSVAMFQSQGGRDTAMAQLFLEQIQGLGDNARVVAWAHNAHIMRGPLSYLHSAEPTMGEYLAAQLGPRYYALGVLFGLGAFHALDRSPDGTWGFRAYQVPPAPQGSLESDLASALQVQSLLDLRSAPPGEVVAQWLGRETGYRWFGGYNITAESLAAAASADRLTRIIPRATFDGIAFLPVTSESQPLDRSLILE